MTHFPDLSPYRYRGGARTGRIEVGNMNTLNIGWLDGDEPYPTGETSDEFKERLLEFCFEDHTFNLTRGSHACNLPGCPIQGEMVAGIEYKHAKPVQRGKQKAFFGSSEIRVVGQSVVYAAPTLVYHYVVAHEYRPPDEFTLAVLDGPSPASDEYWEQLGILCGT